MPFELFGKNGSAGAHANRKHACRYCGKVCKGNGGITSHERACNPSDYRRRQQDKAERRRIFDEAYRIAIRSKQPAAPPAGEGVR